MEEKLSIFQQRNIEIYKNSDPERTVKIYSPFHLKKNGFYLSSTRFCFSLDTIDKIKKGVLSGEANWFDVVDSSFGLYAGERLVINYLIITHQLDFVKDAHKTFPLDPEQLLKTTALEECIYTEQPLFFAFLCQVLYDNGLRFFLTENSKMEKINWKGRKKRTDIPGYILYSVLYGPREKLKMNLHFLFLCLYFGTGQQAGAGVLSFLDVWEEVRRSKAFVRFDARVWGVLNIFSLSLGSCVRTIKKQLYIDKPDFNFLLSAHYGLRGRVQDVVDLDVVSLLKAVEVQNVKR